MRGFTLSNYSLPEVVDCRATALIAKALMELRGGDLVIDASAVTKMGARGAELCLLAQAQWRAQGHQLRFTGWSPSAQEVLDRLGLSPFLIQDH